MLLRLKFNDVYTTVVRTRLILFQIEMVHFRPKGFGGFPPYIIHRLIAHTLGHYYGHILIMREGYTILHTANNYIYEYM